VRKRHVQQELFKKGGKRKGAGRKPKGSRPGTSHDKRSEVKLRHPLHVVLRVVPDVGTLRRRKMYQAMREATIVAAVRERIRIVHVSLQRNHIHLLIEAEDKAALARGKQGFQVAAARHWNRSRGRSGTVFPDRYRPRTLRTRAEVRAALATIGARHRVAWPATHLLRIELSTSAPLARLADPDP
jgi:putative transposase